MKIENQEIMKETGKSLNSKFQTSVSYSKLEAWVSENLLKRLCDRYLISHSEVSRSGLVTSLSDKISFSSVLWGVGFNGDSQEILNLPEEVLAVSLVRGPWTAALLKDSGHKVDPCYGDPALLFGFLFPELEFSAPRKAVGILVAIENKFDGVDQRNVGNGLTFLDPTDLEIEQVEMIVGAELVISTSVTIVAIAESFGIPARFVNPNNNFSLYFSQRDYLAGTDRPYEIIMDSVDESISLGGFSALEIDINYIRDSFPKHFWLEDQSVEFKPQEGSKAPGFVDSELPDNWIQLAIDQQIPVGNYVEVLEDLISSERPISENKISELSCVRYWLEPNLNLADVGYDLQALDYMFRMNLGKVSELLVIQRNGLTATLYSMFPIDCGVLASFVLQSPKILDIPVLLEVDLPKISRTLSVPIPSKTIKLGQTLIDIDVVLNDILIEDTDDMRVVLHFEGGDTAEAIVERGQAPWSDLK